MDWPLHPSEVPIWYGDEEVTYQGERYRVLVSDQRIVLLRPREAPPNDVARGWPLDHLNGVAFQVHRMALKNNVLHAVPGAVLEFHAGANHIRLEGAAHELEHVARLVRSSGQPKHSR